jgi:uncharacterized membrane protein YfcA
MTFDLLTIFGLLASVLIGVSLGLIGGGGSILTVPVLVYLLKVDPVLATAYSLFIVGLSSLVGAIPKYKSGLIDFKTAVVFGIPSIIAVFLTRKVLVPAIPSNLFEFEGIFVTKALAMMLLFALLMVAASVSMIRTPKEIAHTNTQTRVFNYPVILLEGSVVGILTGLVGAGGGFLIIPALVLLSKLPMKQAVGTSLLIIGAKSIIGFTGDVMERFDQINWTLLSLVTALAIIGIFVGNQLSKKIDGAALKKGFGWFVLAMGLYIIIKELFFPGAEIH